MKRTFWQLLLIICILNLAGWAAAAGKPYTIGPGTCWKFPSGRMKASAGS